MTDPDALRRLASIRILLGAAEDIAAQPPPFGSDSINRMHDVVEMFLALAVEKHHRRIPKQFLGYWDELAEPLGRQLSSHAAMERLNKARVSLKHFGIEPTSDEIQRSVNTVRGFLAAETPALFGVELEDVSLAEIVSSEEGKACLVDAERFWEDGEAEQAFASLREAFDVVLEDYERDKPGVSRSASVFDSVPKIPSRRARRSEQVWSGEQMHWQLAVEVAIGSLDRNLKLVGLGIDLRRYGRFKALTPDVAHLASGGRRFAVRDGWSRNQREFDFCRDFVVSTALHLDAYAFTIDDRWATEHAGLSFRVFRTRPGSIDAASADLATTPPEVPPELD